MDVHNEEQPPDKKDKGILTYLEKVGRDLYELQSADYLDDDEKAEMYQRLFEMLQKDINMIQGHRKLYERKLPSKVAKLMGPVDNNVVKVMEQCLVVIDKYLEVIKSRDNEDNVTLLDDCFGILRETYKMIYETEYMLNTVKENQEMASHAGPISEA